MLLIFITFVLSNNLPLTFLFPFLGQQDSAGSACNSWLQGADGEALDFFFGIAYLVSHLSLHLQQSHLHFSIRTF